jgi:hypothetical protein
MALGTILRKKQEIQEFNTIIEGSYHDNWKNFHHKLSYIDVPNNTTAIDDGENVYPLYGVTRDFHTTQMVKSVGELELKTDSLSLSKGVVLSSQGGPFVNILEEPRTICLRDGRIFVGSTMLMEEGYIEWIPRIVESAGEMFKEERLSIIYKKIMLLR